MAFTTLEKVTLEKILFYILILAGLITFVFVFYLFFSRTGGSIELLSPNGGEEWQIASSYKITWKARGIDKVGIVLFKGKEPKWIAQNIPANLGEYEWKIYPGQKYGDDYWIAVFEYPWLKDNKIDFSDNAFIITYPILASCEGLSVKNQWPYAPSDMPDLRKVFITEGNYSGNLGGLDGADRICQSEAKKQGYEGGWQSFLGGESDDDLAVERIKKTGRGTEGVFIEARPEATLIRGASCHRVLAKDFDKFLEVFSGASSINEIKLSSNFFKELDNLWLGRLNEESKKSCVEIAEAETYSDLTQKYSFTVTCQNWTKGTRQISGSSLPTCYTSGGTTTSVAVLGALATGIADNYFTPFQAKYCDKNQKLICIEK